MSRKRVGIDDAIGQGVRGFYSSWLVMLSALWAMAGSALVFLYKAPIGRTFGLPAGSAEALLVDLSLVLSPIVIAVWQRTRKVAAARRARRAAFIAENADQPLLAFLYDPQRIYLVVGETAEGDTVDVVPIWNANGAIENGTVSTAERAAFRPFDANAFAKLD